MPEFPEVYIVTQDLRKILRNGQIKSVTIEPGYSVYPDNVTFIKEVKNALIQDVFQVAKNIVIELNQKKYLNIHLRMTGQVLAKKSAKPLPQERLCLKIETPKKTFWIALRDTRKFGKVSLLNKTEFNNLAAKYGPSPIEPGLTLEKFEEIVKSKNTSIKNLLMKQEKIGGLGNIYATEALFIAGIQPEARTNAIPADKLSDLLNAIKEATNEGIQNRGSTLDDEMFVDIFGKKGHQQQNFRIYGKKTCSVCKNLTIQKKIGGRNTYFCPNCQKTNFDNPPFL